MKSVVLVGGAATRLLPLTSDYNKHLLPLGAPGSGITSVFRTSLHQLIYSGVNEFLFITNPGQEVIFQEILKDFSKKFQFNFQLICSSKPDLPLPDVIYLAKDFVNKDNFILYLGDNLFLPTCSAISLIKMLVNMDDSNRVVVGSSDELTNFGVLEYIPNKNARFIEKPSWSEIHTPATKYILTGLAKYTCNIFSTIETIKSIQYTDLNLCDINNMLLQNEQLNILPWNNLWYDLGSIRSYKEANSIISYLPLSDQSVLDAGLEISLLKEIDLLKQVTSVINTQSYAIY
jgi:glucose-1-phosphate thymidylyltransferase